MLETGGDLREKLKSNSLYFRKQMTDAGFKLAGADHAIIPIMLGDAKLAAEFAEKALEKGIYVVAFSFPVVPKGQARIRTQMSAGHTRAQIDTAIEVFSMVAKEMGLIE